MDNTDEDIIHGLHVPSDPIHGQERHTSEQGSILDSEDDLFLGTDAQVYSASRKPLLSVASSDSVSTGLHYEASNESSGVSGGRRVIKKLAHVGRQESSESLISDGSDFSRSSHDVISLLNAMTVDPEEFLADLGFAEPDMRSRIPDRFLESPSSARGIDVDFFRRSLDQDDNYGSPSQESSVWSDPGSCRIPFRFITSCAEPVNPELSGSYTSVPLISEPEEALEDSFDLMRHLRLNKPCHVTKGLFLEPVTEEVEVSSVGSGTVRTKISRRLSNEEGTIVREESLEQANVESELLLDLPDVENADKGQESNEFTEEKVPKNENNESLIVVTIAQEEYNGSLASKGFVTTDSVKSSDDDAVNLSDGSTKVDYNKSHVSVDLVTKEDEEISPVLPRLAHLKVASVIVQDSFELEEIGSEEFNEKESSSSTDPEAGLNVKSPEKRLTRENSGESSGFEEMMPDKDTLSPSSCSPKLNAKRFSADPHVIDSDIRTPLAALLDPEVLGLAAEKARVSDHFVDEKSPRAAFAQRRSRSLTKQRPVDEDMLASYVYSPSSSTPKETEDLDRSLRMKGNHVASSEDLGPIFNAASTKIKSNIDFSSSGPEFLGMTDENYNTLLKTEPEMTVFEESEIKLGRTHKVADESFEGQLQNNQVFLSTGDDGSAAVSQSEFGLSYVAVTSEESILQSSLVTNDNISERRFENNDYVHLTTDGSENYLRRPGNSVQLGDETEGSRDGLASCDNVLASPASATAESTEAVGACALINQEEPKKPLRKFDSDFQQHYLHEINVLEKSIQKYESTLSSGGPLDALRSVYSTKHMLARITEEMKAIQELRLLVNSELERMKHLLTERRNMLLAGAARDPVGTGVSQKMADLLREQSSLNIGLSNISDELSIRKKASRRARIHSHIESAKRELKEEREKCIREFREEIKEALVRELSEKFCSQIDSLRQEVRIKDALIEQLKKSQDQRESGD